MAKDINKEAFDEKTLLKLAIFREYFKEWLPVFVYNKYKNLYIYDFFAGSGVDANGISGSPLILLEEISANHGSFCKEIENKRKKLNFIFNEYLDDKHILLQENVNKFISQCKMNNCHRETCIFENAIYCIKYDFKELIQRSNLQKVLQDKNFAKFLLLDQYGYSKIDESVFSFLVDSPTTDFIFFVSTSFITRFKDAECVRRFLHDNELSMENKEPKECHRVLADYFRSLIPSDKEFYLHHFTIKKKSNYYGLIFGSSHTYAMEKFLRVCWEKDEYSGESDCNVDNDFTKNTLFYEPKNTNKKNRIKDEIKKRIFAKEIDNNLDGFRFVLRNGCLPQLFTEVVKELEKASLMKRTGCLNYKSTKIHTVEQYNIELKNGEDKNRMD